MPLPEAQLAAATQRAIRDAALGEGLPSETPAWKTLPSWHIFGTADKDIPPAAMRFMAERAGSLKTVELEGASHSSMVSNPDAVAGLILEALSSTD
ncbi:alpha/beta fold hydrolase [Herbiconiux sp. SALV-R1]|uniref:alpha/beta fold hydrolase n=1 Tax=Herbiconiux sp. SALV-R1 TaxID=2735133 RepID=UPI001C111EE9|nr:alpha/beta hydrolase [Herbiconiux sp. SALV-R1]